MLSGVLQLRQGLYGLFYYRPRFSTEIRIDIINVLIYMKDWGFLGYMGCVNRSSNWFSRSNRHDMAWWKDRGGKYGV
jgi:hypothetical protein